MWWGLTVSLVGDGIFFVALPLQVLDLRNDPTALTIVLVAWTLPMVAFLMIGGVLSDRLERRKILILAVTLQGLAVGLIGVLGVAGVLEIWHLLVLAAIYGVGEAMFGPAFGSIVPDLVPTELLVQANALDNLSRPLALRVAGPALGGIIIATIGLGNAFLVDAGTFVVGMIAFLLIAKRPAAATSTSGFIWTEIKVGLSYVRSQSWLWGGFVSIAVGLLVFYGPWQTLVPFVVINKLNGNESDLAMILSVGGVGAVISSLIIGQRSLPKQYLTAMYLAFGVGTLMLTGFGLATETWHAAAASFMMQALLTAGIITWATTLHRMVPGEVLGRVSGLDWMVSTSLIPVSLAVAGPLSKAIGPDNLLVGAGLVGCAAVLSFLSLPGIRAPERTSHPAEVASEPL